jgi:hypothetical protein
VGLYGDLDKLKFARIAYDNAKEHSLRRCAHFICDALQGAGLASLPRPDRAYQYSTTNVLRIAGFVQVSPEGYRPQVGDIVIWLPCLSNPVKDYPNGASHTDGHIQVYTGDIRHRWVSDFKQNDKSLPGLPATGAGWKTKRAVYEIYRYRG